VDTNIKLWLHWHNSRLDNIFCSVHLRRIWNGVHFVHDYLRSVSIIEEQATRVLSFFITRSLLTSSEPSAYSVFNANGQALAGTFGQAAPHEAFTGKYTSLWLERVYSNPYFCSLYILLLWRILLVATNIIGNWRTTISTNLSMQRILIRRIRTLTWKFRAMQSVLVVPRRNSPSMTLF
jgi:hypothetical protein